MPLRRVRQCGCSLEQPQAKRRRRGEQPIISIRDVTCSAKCRYQHRLATIWTWQREPRRRMKASQNLLGSWLALDRVDGALSSLPATLRCAIAPLLHRERQAT